MKSAIPYIGMGLAALLISGCGSSDSDNDGDSSSSSMSSSSAANSSSENSSSHSSDANDGWALVWSDEFEDEEIDASKWSHEVNCAGGGNNELQCYTASEENSYIDDGKLYLVAKAQSHSGPAVFDDDPAYDADDTSVTRDYTSARLRSKNKGDWRFGRMEINARMPQGQGIWPAIWMMPTESVYGGWAASGEIDIFEAVNSNTEGTGNEIHGTLHYGGNWPNNVYSGAAYTPEAPIWEDFHTYAVEWEEGEIRWYIDDEHFATQTDEGWFTYYWAGQEQGFQLGEGAAPFDELFHLIMNVAVGGDWPEAPNEATEFPQQMVVDYVRVYECSADPETGKGCATDVDDSIEPLKGNPAPEQNEFLLYQDGPQPLNLSSDEEEHTLVPGFYEASSGNVVSNPGSGEGEDGAWSIMFNGPGNVFLNTESMPDGLRLTNMAQFGELRFELRVESIDEATQLLVKLDSEWPNVSAYAIDVPETGEWASVSVAFADLEPNSIEPGEVDLGRVINPFVIEAVDGTAEIKLNNIRIRCRAECGLNAGVVSVLEESFDVFVDGEEGEHWDFGVGTWDGDSDHVSVSTVEDEQRGDVLQLEFSQSSNNGLAFVQSTNPKDASAFAEDGQLQFDIKVLSYGSNTSGLVVKAESAPSTGTFDYILDPAPLVGEWTSVSIDVSDMLNNPDTHPDFDISAFNTPFVFFPVWNDQSGVEVQLDNIRWVR